MKTSIVVVCLLLSFSVFAQPTVTEQFQKITTVQQAEQYVTANKELKPAILRLSYGRDSSLIEKRLLRQKKGDIFSVGYVTYKVVEATDTVAYRCSYVFLDEGSLSPKELDSLRTLILKKLNAGAAIDKLSDEYSMDGNNTHGDTGWFFGEAMVPKELQEAVKNHKLGDVFTVDVSEKQWHYIVKKTYDDQIKKDITVLRANGR